jgi:hypothetical protein
MSESNEPITEQARMFNVSRDQVLTRLWEIANMDPERTRNSMTAQVKAIAMIVAIEGHIPDRRAVPAAKNQPVPPRDHSSFYAPPWLLARQQGNFADSQTPPAEVQEEKTPDLQSTSGSADVPQAPAAQPASAAPRVPTADHVAPDTRVRFSLDNRFRRRR